MTEATISVRTHGRYLARPGSAHSVLVGFHGYGEAAEDQMPRLETLGGTDGWTLVSIQALNRFYERRTDRVVACWMTRQDRELAMADNITYVASVLDHVLDGRAPETAAFAGFSQGVAMAYRAAVTSRAAKRYVVAVGGDIPPEIEPAALSALSGVLVCRGADDPWYAQATFDRDVGRLRASTVPVDARVIAGGHEWSSDVTSAARDLLRSTTAPLS